MVLPKMGCRWLDLDANTPDVGCVLVGQVVEAASRLAVASFHLRYLRSDAFSIGLTATLDIARVLHGTQPIGCRRFKLLDIITHMTDPFRLGTCAL